MTLDEIKGLLNFLDADKNGSLDIDEFITFLIEQ